MNKDYSKVVKSWPASSVYYNYNHNSICDINTEGSGIPNLSTNQSVSSTVLPSNFEHDIQNCTYNVADVSVIDQVDNFGIIYGDQDPDKVLLLHGFCQTNPTHEMCFGIEQTLCSTFPFHPNCKTSVQTGGWSWVYTVIIIGLVVLLVYMVASPSTKTESYA